MGLIRESDMLPQSPWRLQNTMTNFPEYPRKHKTWSLSFVTKCSKYRSKQNLNYLLFSGTHYLWDLRIVTLDGILYLQSTTLECEIGLQPEFCAAVMALGLGGLPHVRVLQGSKLCHPKMFPFHVDHSKLETCRLTRLKMKL